MLPLGWTMGEKIVRFVLRLPPDLHEKLKELAEREDRSLHGQIIHLLRQAIAQKP
jgi:hypothetical protein